jgi:type II secretion system (T2SS) protein E
MSQRLGEVLIQKGIIDERQLKVALDAQLIYGGHLGTCLIEQGFIDVDRLAEILGEQFNLNHADRQQLDDVDRRVIDAMPRRLVERHSVVPFALVGRVLHVAMLDPRNLMALDEISFACGYRIEAWVAPEVVIARAMERYYDVTRRLRHIPLSGERRKVSPPKAAPAAEAAPTPAQVEAVREDLQRLTETAAATSRFIAQQPRATETETTGAMWLEWVKQRKAGTERWCNLFEVSLDDPQFDSLDGIYVIWQFGPTPVLAVGHGRIREHLERARLDPRFVEKHETSAVYATWARVDPASVQGVQRYLADVLDPAFFRTASGTARALAVNLPR